jgi:hypothetical protein
MRSEQVSLELAALPTVAPAPGVDAPLVLVVASDADVRAYVSDTLRTGTTLAVVATGTIAGALDVAVRRTPRVLVVSRGEQGVVRHLPGIPAVLLSDEVPAEDPSHPRRLAPLVVLRGAFRVERLLDVVASLLAGGIGAASMDVLKQDVRAP